ncbi:MAG TPA: Spy/CpxP family protein refolding chaperone [Candidatus Sulfopaludibacter sp.]|nr:Spy/CpxP family protein refolding chaperone [Candidatus Sulfopaludibacter sp.]
MVLRVFLATLLAAGLASAQRNGGGGSRNRGGDEMDAGMSRQRQSRFDVIADKLKLNKDQKEEASKIFDAAQEAANPLNEQILNGRNQMTAAIVQGQNSGDNYQKLMAAYTSVLSQMATVEATAYGKLYTILKPNQQSKASQVFAEQMAGMFAGRDWKRMR